MDVDILSLNKSMDMANFGRGNAGRMISPYHFATVRKISWNQAKAELDTYAKCGFLIRFRNGQYRVLEFSIDD